MQTKEIKDTEGKVIATVQTNDGSMKIPEVIKDESVAVVDKDNKPIGVFTNKNQ